MVTSQTNGVLNIFKPAGITSHDVIARLRRVFRQRRIGHAGTLDPAARGVLLVGLGRATRVLEYLGELPKTYRARVVLGTTTDTLDAEGTVTGQASCEHVRWEDIQAALERFRGEIRQVPPMYAAIKRGGRPLHELARQGIVVPREARLVRIYALTALAWEPPRLDLDVVCSQGTYIRALARDLGETLGTGAYLASLTRTAIGPHTLCTAVGLSALERGGRERAQGAIMGIRQALSHLPSIQATDDQAVALRQGRSLKLYPAPSHAPALALDSQDEVIAILVPENDGMWHPTKVLMPASQAEHNHPIGL